MRRQVHPEPLRRGPILSRTTPAPIELPHAAEKAQLRDRDRAMPPQSLAAGSSQMRVDCTLPHSPDNTLSTGQSPHAPQANPRRIASACHCPKFPARPRLVHPPKTATCHWKSFAQLPDCLQPGLEKSTRPQPRNDPALEDKLPPARRLQGEGKQPNYAYRTVAHATKSANSHLRETCLFHRLHCNIGRRACDKGQR